MRAAILVALATACALASPAQARDYGQAGAVWRVTEPDLLAVIKARLERMQASGEMDRHNEELKRRTIARVNRPAPVIGLVAASTPRSWTIDPTITVSADIADDKGRVIWPRGTRVNPLDTVPLRSVLVFLDGDDNDQLGWATRTYGAATAKLILTNGAPLELMKARQRRFFFDQGGTLVANFGIKALPAIVDQQGRTLRVREIALPPKDTRR